MSKRHPSNRAERLAHKQRVKAKRHDYFTVTAGSPRRYADSKQAALTMQERRQWIDTLEAMLSPHIIAEVSA